MGPKSAKSQKPKENLKKSIKLQKKLKKKKLDPGSLRISMESLRLWPRTWASQRLASWRLASEAQPLMPSLETSDRGPETAIDQFPLISLPKWIPNQKSLKNQRKT